MAQPQIVSCPGCGKRYTVPPGAAPGQFQCQDCSAVVVYGQAAHGGHGGQPHGAGSAKKAAGAAGAWRKGHDRHAAGEEDEGRGRHHAGPPPQRQNAMLYVLGLVTLGILAAGTVFLLQQTKKEPAKTTATAKKGSGGELSPEGGGEGGGEGSTALLPGGAPGTTGTPAPVPLPAVIGPSTPPPSTGGGLKAEPRAAKGAKAADKFTPVDNPPTGGNYAKSEGELRMMLKRGRAELLLPLDHLPDTTADLRTQIDADVARIADHDAGTEALKAAERLAKVGRAAIPRILSVAAKLDFSGYKDIKDARDDGVIAQSVDDVMRRITGYDNEKIPALQYTPSANLADFQRNAEEWYVWWLSTGYKRATFYKQADEGEEESL